MVKAILFDFWGTLAENGIWSPIKQVKDVLGIKEPFSEYVVRMEKAMMTRKFESLHEAFEEVCREFKIECNEEKIELLIGLWNKSWMLAKPYQETLEELQKLKDKYRLLLISNTDCISINRVLDKYQMRPLFEGLFFSCEMNMIKTDQNFLKFVLEKSGLNAEDCVLVGDSLQSDIMAAKEMGIKAVLVDRKNMRDYHPKIKSLKELEKVLTI